MRNNDGWFMRITAAGLVPLLLLASLSGCVARHDWSKVQAVAPDTPTEVQLSEDGSPYEDRKIKGRLLSATEDSVTLKLKDGNPKIFQKKDVRKVLTRRPVAKRWAAWVTLGVSALIVSKLFAGLDTPEARRAIHLYTTLPVTTVAFFGAKMGGIYQSKPIDKDWHPQETIATGAGTEKPKDEK